jgi:hypothetical protein
MTKDHETLFAEADAAGKAAYDAVDAVKASYVERVDPLDESSAVARRFPEFEPEGWAAVTLRDGRTSFARYAKRHGFRSSPEYGVFMSAPGRGYERRRAYALAFAETLTRHGVAASHVALMD